MKQITHVMRRLNHFAWDFEETKLLISLKSFVVVTLSNMIDRLFSSIMYQLQEFL